MGIIIRNDTSSQTQDGRPRATNIREVLNAVFYILRASCAWRLLSRDFPNWKTVYHYWREWRIIAVFIIKRLDNRSV